LDEKDIKKYQNELSEILDYFNKLNELDVEGIEPIGHITGIQNVFRSDRQEDFGLSEKAKILKNVPESKDGYIKVKSVL
jgi:aspartyl-tRNA(Asn)/glutamyl-tRNA(Gln) amidotransferase subunit C